MKSHKEGESQTPGVKEIFGRSIVMLVLFDAMFVTEINRKPIIRHQLIPESQHLKLMYLN